MLFMRHNKCPQISNIPVDPPSPVAIPVQNPCPSARPPACGTISVFGPLKLASVMTILKPISIVNIIALILASTASITSTRDTHGLELTLFSARMSVSSTGCHGTIGECMTGEEEAMGMMDGELNRHNLSNTRNSSYGALDKNSVSCSRHGASYYNSKAGAKANPYNRGCSKIPRCRQS
ncbi:RALF-like 1-like protein [Drosera capensis]